MYPKGKLIALTQGGTLWDNQPIAEDEPASFPTDDPSTGNDDRSVTDERNDPYVAVTGDEYRNHGVSELSSSDSPTFSMRNSTGNDGNTSDGYVTCTASQFYGYFIGATATYI